MSCCCSKCRWSFDFNVNIFVDYSPCVAIMIEHSGAIKLGWFSINSQPRLNNVFAPSKDWTKPIVYNIKSVREFGVKFIHPLG